MAKACAMKEENDWRIEEDVRTLARAEEIKKDPKRMAAAKKMAQEKIERMKTIASGAV